MPAHSGESKVNCHKFLLYVIMSDWPEKDLGKDLNLPPMNGSDQLPPFFPFAHTHLPANKGFHHAAGV